MSTPTHVRRIAIAGASGNVGRSILKYLLPSNNPSFTVTAIARPDSTSALPTADNLTIARGSLDDHAFLVSTLRDQDVLIIALGIAAPPASATNLFKAAAEAGVPYVLPTEFGSDLESKPLVAAIPMLAHKAESRRAIEKLGVSKWIAIITNPWTDYGLVNGGFSIDIKARKATIWTGPQAVKGYTTSLDMVGRGVAELLSLPLQGGKGEKNSSVADYANSSFYVRSFYMTQREMLEGVQNVVGKEGWEIAERDLQGYLEEGAQLIKDGNFRGNIFLIYGNTFNKGVGDVYTAEPANQRFGLPEESFEEVVKQVVQEIGA